MIRNALVAALLLLLCLLLATACATPAYYSQAIGGHLSLMADRQDIDDWLTGNELDSDAREKLQLAEQARGFASRRLGLPDNDSYTQFVKTGQDAVTWNVVAADEFSVDPMEWCFAFAGCVPYRGYFNRDNAQKFAQKLEAKGLETDVSGAIAYSTLGWFDDPLLDTMLKYDSEQLVAFIFHELAHQQIYIKGDTWFNEAYASFVEAKGVAAWLDHLDQTDQLAKWQQRNLASLEFNELLMRYRDRLQDLYSSSATDQQKRDQKRLLFEQLKTEYEEFVEHRWGRQDFFAGWFNSPLNNARLALMSSYEAGQCAFEHLWLESGESFEQFHSLATEKSELQDDARHRWLKTNCESIAQQHEL